MFPSLDIHEEPPPGECRICARPGPDLCPRCFICPVCVCWCETPAPICAGCGQAYRRCADCRRFHLCGCIRHRSEEPDDDGDFVPWET